MLFNSPEFIFAFLPATLFLYFLLGRWTGLKTSIGFLALASLFFYSWWNPIYLLLILVSIVVNFSLGLKISKTKDSRALLFLGVAFNLGLLGYYKYSHFLLENLNWFSHGHLHIEQIVLPLAISFFTFQQIAFLVDAKEHVSQENNFLNYCLFVCFFPQLIAGPIVHHKEMLPQFQEKRVLNFSLDNFSLGFVLFLMGLFKKLVLADNLAPLGNEVFLAAQMGQALTTIEAWGGLLTYTLQLYFDFSGYSDMAIGLARLFNIKLPMNFNSPYRAANIITFWRRWHMTLSRFLRDYLYIPLGGNKKGAFRRQINLLVTMLLGGLWHGAGWNFLIWGGLHGIYLVVNHLWRHVRIGRWRFLENSKIYRLISWTITFVSVTIAWTFFKAESLSGALNLLKGLFQPTSFDQVSLGPLRGLSTTLLLVFCLALAWWAPNTQQILYRFKPVFEVYKGELKPPSRPFLEFQYNWFFGSLLGIILFLVIKTALTLKVSEFLYFQF